MNHIKKKKGLVVDAQMSRSMDGAALTETDQQGAGWEGLGSSKEMRLETQVEFQAPLPCQRAVRPEGH